MWVLIQTYLRAAISRGGESKRCKSVILVCGLQMCFIMKPATIDLSFLWKNTEREPFVWWGAGLCNLAGFETNSSFGVG